LPEVKRIESFTEAKLRISARTTQLTPTVLETSKMKANVDSKLDGSV
jgi:hypothetical protein